MTLEKVDLNNAVTILSRGKDRIETTKRLISILNGLHNIGAIGTKEYSEINENFISVMKIVGIEGSYPRHLEDIFRLVIDEPEAKIFDDHLEELSEAGSFAYDVFYNTFVWILEDIDRTCGIINQIIKE